MIIMFEHPIFQKVLTDSFIRALLLAVLSELLFSGYIVAIPVLGTILGVILTLAPVFSAWLFSKSEEQNKRILGFALSSFLLGLFFYLCLMMLSIVFSIRLFPTDYMSNASAILFLGLIPYALLCTTILRIIVFLFFFLRNIAKNKQNKGLYA